MTQTPEIEKPSAQRRKYGAKRAPAPSGPLAIAWRLRSGPEQKPRTWAQDY